MQALAAAVEVMVAAAAMAMVGLFLLASSSSRAHLVGSIILRIRARLAIMTEVNHQHHGSNNGEITQRQALPWPGEWLM